MESLELENLAFEVPVATLLEDVVACNCKGTSIHNQLRQPGKCRLDMCRHLVFVGGCKDKCHMHR